MDQNDYWIITWSRSSSSLDHHYTWMITWSRSSSSLDHHHTWIITWFGSSSSLDHPHHRCYLSILLVIGISIEPTLFHVVCRPTLHVGIHQCLYMTLSQNGSASTYIWPLEEHIHHHVRKACPRLTSDHGRNTSTTMLERTNTHIWPWEA